jgi:hypothetical protein
MFSTNLGIMFAVKGPSHLPFTWVMGRWPVPPVALHAPLSPGLSPSQSEPIPTAYDALQTVLASKCLGLVAIVFNSRLFRGLLSCKYSETVDCATLYRGRMLHLRQIERSCLIDDGKRSDSS